MQCLHVRESGNRPLSKNLADLTGRHPCFSVEARHRYARMHLPIAPRCNLNCNYCSRKYDCLHESRPGVTSEVLSPAAALDRYLQVKKQIPSLSVVGIAGPGDALANWDETRDTLEQIRRIDPHIIFCLSTNGLMLPAYGRELIDLGVKHLTVTVNCLDPLIGARIYRHIDYRGKRLAGEEGAQVLLENQIRGITFLKDQDAVVKINTVMIPGINDRHIPEIAWEFGRLGVYVGNIMPLIPAPGSAFQDLPPVCPKELANLRRQCAPALPQMYHCRQCRADAAGLLGQDLSIASLAAR